MAAGLKEMFSVEGKVALITGGNGGIGKGIAEGMAAAGADIAITARNEEKTAKAVKDVREKFGVKVSGFTVDVLKDQTIFDMIANVSKEFGRIDILVNNAGLGIHKHPQDMTIEEWDLNVDTNLRSVFVCSKAAYPVMKKAGGGNIINVASMFAIFGAGPLCAYAASKGGIVQLTKSLAIAWAPDNIRVNAVAPGFINTDLSAGGKRDIPGFEQLITSRTPAGRWGEPEDCAGAAVFLAGASAGFITGAVIAVDGGYSVM
ncbi:MAG: glucose 1-dehydrogenase [Desulfomonilaceae bacterium]